MGIEEIKLRTNAAAVDSVKANTVRGEELIQNVDFTQARAIGAYEQNSKSNSFLKEYLLGKAGNKLPAGMTINVSSPKEYSDEFKALLKSVRVNIYGARVADMFKLIAQDAATVEKRVSQMKISDEEKSKILTLKAMFDDYYRIEANYNGKAYDLLNMSDAEKAELAEISPEFAKFLEKEQPELKANTIKFAQGELENFELSEAGMTSKEIAYVLGPALLASVGYSTWSAKADVKDMKADPKGFMEQQREIYKKGDPLKNTARNISKNIRNPKQFVASKFKGLRAGLKKNPFKGMKGMNKAQLIRLAGLTFIGAWDDLSGAVKDYFQDRDNFGGGTSLAINLPAAAFGLATSAAISPMIDKQISFNRASKYLTKAGEIQKVSKLRSLAGKGGKFAALGLVFMGAKSLANVALNAVQGCVIASCSSGSSWGSMAGTRYVMANNGDKLVEKNIIDKEDNTFEATNENMMKYEAYRGKWRGIAVGETADPVIGSVLGGAGMLTHSNPYVQAAAFAAQGCSETITACGYQALYGNHRESQLDKEKQKLVDSTRQS